MLFQMSFEAALKGIIVEKLTESASAKIHRALTIELSPNFLAEYFEGRVSADDQAVIDRYHSEEQEADRQALDTLLRLKTHDLATLVHEAGLRTAFTDVEMGILRTLTLANQFGRYPARFDGQRVTHIDFIDACDPDKINSIQRKIDDASYTVAVEKHLGHLSPPH